MRLVWTAQAAARLAAIRAYIAADSPEAARRHMMLLVSKGNALVEFPRIGRRVPERPEGDLREVIVKGYRIVYRLLGDDILEVVTVLEGHRLLRDEELADQ